VHSKRNLNGEAVGNVSLMHGPNTTLADFIGLIVPTGFPNQVLNDSWVVGLWKADQWTLTGKPISIAGLRRLSRRCGTRRGPGWALSLCRGFDRSRRPQERPTDGGARQQGRLRFNQSIQRAKAPFANL
jgi:hypothetical protein